jgi:Fe-S cluster assembly iron-binding protein IscA
VQTAIKFYVTEDAQLALQRFLRKRNDPTPIRVGVKNSFKYYVECVDSIKETDIQFHFGELIIILDDLSAHLLNGSVLHWLSTEKHKGLKIYNPSEDFWHTFSEVFSWLKS